MTQVIGYVKTDQGPVIVSNQEVNLGKRPATAYQRFDNLFNNVPLFGGREWKSLSVDQLTQLFITAADEVVKFNQERHDHAVQEHAQRNWLSRWWKEIRGWQAPIVPSRRQVIEGMINRCLNLANWMSANQSRRFYQDSDMSDYIIKPQAVADHLAKAM